MEEWRRWLCSWWEMLKETLFQKLFTHHLPLSPLLPSTDLSGLSVIITGATNGIGLHTARALAMTGAHVILACRNTKAANEIARAWGEEAHSNRIPNVEVEELDLLSMSSIQRFATEWERRAQPLHVLINNAGVFLEGEPQRFSNEGLEQHMHVNHVAPALLTLLLLPSLLKAPSSRIINVNSVGHHLGMVEPKYWNSRIEDNKFSNLRAYGSSKLVHLMFLKALASKLLEQRKDSICCIAVHPGAVMTNLTTNMRRNLTQRKLFWMFDAVEGARSVIYCATRAEVVDNISGGFAYYSCSCEPGKMSPKAMDMDACFEVWQKTLEILQLDIDEQFNVLENRLS